MAVIKVEVYRNLHQDNWSVREQKTGLVIDHVPYICIKNAKLIVRYNPYENESFVLKDTNDSIKWSENVFLDSDGIGWSYGKYN